MEHGRSLRNEYSRMVSDTTLSNSDSHWTSVLFSLVFVVWNCLPSIRNSRTCWRGIMTQTIEQLQAKVAELEAEALDKNVAEKLKESKGE